MSRFRLLDVGSRHLMLVIAHRVPDV